MIAAASAGTDSTLPTAITAGAVLLAGIVGAGAAILSATLTSKREAANLQARLEGERTARKLDDERHLRDAKRVRFARLYEAAIRAATGIRDVAQRSTFELVGEDPEAQKRWRTEQTKKAQEQFEIASVPLQIEVDAKSFAEQFAAFNKKIVAYYVAFGTTNYANQFDDAEAALKRMIEIAISDLAKLESPL